MSDPEQPQPQPVKDAGDVAKAGARPVPEGEPISAERRRVNGKAARRTDPGSDAPPHGDAVDPAQPIPLWHRRLTFGKAGDCKATVGNCELIFCNDPGWRGVVAYNERSNLVVFRSPPPFDQPGPVPREISNTDVSRAALWLERTKPYCMPISPRSDNLHGAIDVAAQHNPFDPVRQYLESITWDGTSRIDNLLIRYCGADDLLINQIYARKWMIGAVARVFDPGCKVDTMLVLVGQQGVRKSWFGSVLAGARHFGDNLPPLDNKDAADYLLGLWIVEMAELDALSRGELATAKAFLSRSRDRYRAAYARRVEEHPRRCIFFGTTNEQDFLRDATGGRRFWPVQVERVLVDDIARDRDQLWAEAVHRYRAGETWYLTDQDDIAEAAETQEHRFQVDAWEPAIVRWLDEPPQHLAHRFTTGHIMGGALKLEIGKWNRADQMRVAAILHRLGWRRRQARGEDGQRDYFYYRPGFDTRGRQTDSQGGPATVTPEQGSDSKGSDT